MNHRQDQCCRSGIRIILKSRIQIEELEQGLLQSVLKTFIRVKLKNQTQIVSKFAGISKILQNKKFKLTPYKHRSKSHNNIGTVPTKAQ